MPRIDFVFSNPGHHTAMMLPVAESLGQRENFDCRGLSLCELRGLPSPVHQFEEKGLELERVVPAGLRSSPSAGKSNRGSGEGPGLLRQLSREIAWRVLLGRPLRRLWRDPPDLVVVPNDDAYPYDRIGRLLRSRGIPFVLIQEGIRFPLPANRAQEHRSGDGGSGSFGSGGAYGLGGAMAIAVWGEISAEYFRAQGVPAERLHLTGNPRFDFRLDAEAKTPRRKRARRHRTLLLLTNPIDDQGFCSHDEKLTLIRRFGAGVAPLLASGTLRLILKLHPRESPQEYRQALAGVAPDAIKITEDSSLPALFSDADAAVVLASTVGLEALLDGLPLGVVEIPGHGFIYDYVSSGAARGLTLERPLAPQVEALLAPDRTLRGIAEEYLKRNFATRKGATERISQMIVELLEGESDRV